MRPTLEEIQELCRKHVAGYKIPRELHVVDKVETGSERQARLPVGRGRHRPLESRSGR